MSVQEIKTLTILEKTFGRFHAVIPRSVAGILLFMGLPMLTENMDLLMRSYLNLFAIILFITMAQKPCHHRPCFSNDVLSRKSL